MLNIRFQSPWYVKGNLHTHVRQHNPDLTCEMSHCSACISALYHYITRKQKHSRGQRQMQAVSKQQSTIASKKSALVSKYANNWAQIIKVFQKVSALDKDKSSLLKGLQKLDHSDDVKFFEEWGSQTGSYTSHTELNLSWIWRVAMEEWQSCCFTSGDFEKSHALTSSWESEGRFL